MSYGRASIYCPHCRMHTALSVAPGTVDRALLRPDAKVLAAWGRENDNHHWWIGVCNACGRPVLVYDDAELVYPTQVPAPSDENIPEEIRLDLDEAKMCLAVSAWRAAAVMARRAIQHAALDQGAEGDKLVRQIADLESKHLITAEVRKWADAVRWVGNDAAHPDSESVDKADATEILELAEQFLHVIYVAPARARSLRERRNM